MLIQAPCVVTLTWRLEDTLGALIDELAEPVDFFYGGDDLLAKVEEVLEGQSAGYKTTLHLEPEHAFGDYDADMVLFEARDLFAEQVELGMQFEGPPEGSSTPGMPRDAVFTVTEVYPTHVVLDGNHPLAGIALRLALKVQGVREATSEEIEQRSVGHDSLSGGPSSPPHGHIH